MVSMCSSILSFELRLSFCFQCSLYHQVGPMFTSPFHIIYLWSVHIHCSTVPKQIYAQPAGKLRSVECRTRPLLAHKPTKQVERRSPARVSLNLNDSLVRHVVDGQPCPSMSSCTIFVSGLVRFEACHCAD